MSIKDRRLHSLNNSTEKPKPRYNPSYIAIYITSSLATIAYTTSGFLFGNGIINFNNFMGFTVSYLFLIFPILTTSLIVDFVDKKTTRTYYINVPYYNLTELLSKSLPNTLKVLNVSSSKLGTGFSEIEIQELYRGLFNYYKDQYKVTAEEFFKSKNIGFYLKNSVSNILQLEQFIGAKSSK
jgi:hypothetical protein